DVGWYVVKPDRRAAGRGVLRVDDERVVTARRQGARVDEGASAPGVGGGAERSAVGLEQRDDGEVHGHVAELEADPLAGASGKGELGVLAWRRRRDGHASPAGRDRRVGVGRDSSEEGRGGGGGRAGGGADAC